MADISLRAYDHEIEDLIERGHHLDEAIAHCNHILKTFPKHLATYRLLGKAYLEAKRYDDAVDIFQRVLLADPEDFVSHVGMSIIADDQDKLDDAIWHMQRAFEVQPSNAAIQGELQRLFGRRDGVEPPKIRLTRGALAHMYVRGDLYSQAVSEIRSVLDQDPKRTDMQVLLAKAYVRSGQKSEAANVCAGLLTWYPYCLDANRIMVEILPGTERADSVQEYRERLIELDPYFAFVPNSASDSDHVADTAVSLERLEEVPVAAGAGDALGIGAGAEAAATGLPADQPSWLASASADKANSSSLLQPEADIPAFLRQARWIETGEGAQELTVHAGAESEPVPDVVPGSVAQWVKAPAPTEETPPEGEPQASDDELPDWLRSTGHVQSGGARPASEQVSESGPPLWLQNLGGRDLDQRSPVMESEGDGLPGAVLPAKTEPSDGAEAWSMPATEAVRTPGPSDDDSTGSTEAENAEVETPAQESDSPQSWETPGSAATGPAPNLDSFGATSGEQYDALASFESAEKEDAREDELVTEPNARSEVAPDGVDKTKGIGEPAKYEVDAFDSTPGAQPAASDSDEPGGGLGNVESNQGATAPPMGGPTRGTGPLSSDWLSGLSEPDDFAVTEADSEKAEGPILGEHEPPGFLSDLGLRLAQSPSIDEAPAWMNADTSKAPNSPSGMAAEPVPESPSASDLPDWLAGLEEEESGSPTDDVESDELPAWLHPEPKPAAPMAEPTRPADWQPAEAAESLGAVTSGITKALGDHAAAEETASAGASILSKAQAESPASASIAPRSKPGPATVSAAGGPSLGAAKSELGRGNIAAALDIYDKLIRRGKSLEEIIRDLRDALYRYPVEVPIWQALGDAYMRANRLQEALDAYTKAEELMR